MAPDAANQGEPRQEPAPGADAQPKRLGGFELLGRLGKGGMGTVLKARQVSMDRLVALKILPQKLAKDERFVQRFLREARSAAKLRHPNIVQAFDVGQTEGYYFFAMEFVDGETLEALVRRDGPLEPDRALHVMKEVASALAAAHEAGLVHRDIKPSNIMIDKKGEVRVTDFGLAKHTEGDVEVTADGSIVGTPAYFAPETAKGGKADHRSDLYSLGATIFCTLAGRPPFDGKSFAEVIAKKVTEDSPPLASLAPRADRRLCHIIDRLLHKNPEARYASAEALLDDLNGLGKLQSVAGAARAEGRALIAEAPTLEMSEGKRRAHEARGPRPTVSGRRPTTLIAAGAVVAILAIVGIILATRRPRVAATRPETATAPPVKPPDPKAGLPVFVDDEEAKLTVEAARAANARQQYDGCVRAADAALAQKDYGKARAAMQPALSLGVPGVAELARSKLSEIDALEKNAAVAEKLIEGEWVSLFDGKTLDGWRVMEGGRFAGHGEVRVEGNEIVLETGRGFTAVARTTEYPSVDYELALEVKREGGQEAFCKIFLPVGATRCALSIGGWGGAVVGLSNVDGLEAPDNLTGKRMAFAHDRWYRLRVRVTEAQVEVWIDEDKVVDLPRAGHRLSPRTFDEGSVGFGLGNWQTRSIMRNVRMRRLKRAEPRPEPVGGWVSLFDGKSLDGWRVIEEGVFARHGEVQVERGELVMGRAGDWTGIARAGDFPTQDFEIELEAVPQAVQQDICSISFPLGLGGTQLAINGLGGGRVGLAGPDGVAPLEGTVTPMTFVAGRAYRVRLRVAGARVQAWIDEQQIVDFAWKGELFRRMDYFRPMSIYTVGSRTALRSIRMRRLKAEGPQAAVERGDWALLFPGGGAHATAPHVPFDTWQAFTVEAWVKDWQEAILCQGQGSDPENSLWLSLGNRPNVGIPHACCGWESGAGANYEAAIGNGVTGAWNHVAMTYENGQQRIFLNGQLRHLHQAPKPGPLLKDRPFVLGAHHYDTGLTWGRGILGPVRVSKVARYHEAFTPAARWQPDADTMLLLLLDEGQGEAARDSSASGNHARLIGATWVKADQPIPQAEGAKPGEWVSLFDGKTLDGWSVVRKFVSIAPQDGDGTGGDVYVKDGWLVLEPGRPMTGIAWTRAFPETDYEVELEAMRLQGLCDFASFTFPAGQEHCTFHGACHAQFVGLSRVDGRQCHENGTGRAIRYENGRWYRIRLQVTASRVRAWIDETPVVDFARAGRALAPHAPEVRPFGVWNWMGKSAVRSVRVRRIAPAPQDKEPAPEPPPKPLALPPGGQWLSLFDGKTLDGWRVVPFLPGPRGGRGGTAEVRDGHIILGAGMPFTAIAWTGGFPTSDYEVRVEAARILGRDDFCSIVFPLGATGCIWVVGGCRGSGIEVLDNANAAWNETAERLVFQQGRPCQVHLRVTKARLEGWIDEEKVFDTLTAGHTFALRDFAQPVAPFGIFTWNTSAALRNVSVRAIAPRADDGPPPDEPPAGAKPVEAAALAVAARANWFDTGLYVTQGKAYELSASGQWGTDPTWPACGAEGTPGRPAPNSPLVGADVVFNLIGRVGALGRPFHVGERRALTPETTGRLYLRMNDCITGDNWGSLRVTVAGPLLADADAPLLARFTNEVRKLSLDAKSDWTDTGVAVQLGQKLLIAAAGTWQAAALLPPSNADGYREALAFLRRGALVGKIGEQGRPFHVGQLLLLDATKAGKLYLAMNDDARDDNQGSLTVTISSPPKPVAPGPPKPP